VHGERGGADDGERDPSLGQPRGDPLEQAQPISSSMQRQGRRPL
jgi:hypothetical protein